MTTSRDLDNHLEDRHQDSVLSRKTCCIVMSIFFFVAVLSCYSFMGVSPSVNIEMNDKRQNGRVDDQIYAVARRHHGSAYLIFCGFLPPMIREKTEDADGDTNRRVRINKSFIGRNRKTRNEFEGYLGVGKGCQTSDLMSIATNSAWVPIFGVYDTFLEWTCHGLILCILEGNRNDLNIYTTSLTRGIIIWVAFTLAVTFLNENCFWTAFGYLCDVVAAFSVSNLILGTIKITWVGSGGILDIFWLRFARRVVSSWHGLFVEIFRKYPKSLDISRISLTHGIMILAAMTSAVAVLSEKLFLTAFGYLFDVVAAFSVSYLMFGGIKMTWVGSGGILDTFCLRGNRRVFWQCLKRENDSKPPRIAGWKIGGDWVGSLILTDSCWSYWSDFGVERN